MNNSIPIDPALPTPHLNPLNYHLNQFPTPFQYGTDSLLSFVAAGSSTTVRQHQAGIPVEALSVPDYKRYKLGELKELCKARRLKVGGKKQDLVSRLEADDKSHLDQIPSSTTLAPPPLTNLAPSSNHHPANSVTWDQVPISSTAPLSDSQVEEEIIDVAQVLKDSASLAGYFDDGLENGVNGGAEEVEEEVGGDDEDEGDIDEESIDVDINIPGVKDTLTFADQFILETRRKGGRQTEQSVLKQWKKWACEAIESKTIQDLIVDSHHIIEYLKYAATRQLFSTRGKKLSSGRLSASSLKKIMTMLGRVRRRQEEEDPSIKTSRPAKTSRTDDFYKAVMVQAQRLRLETEDFDVTKGTILDSQLRPAQFEEITEAIFMKLNQLPSTIKAHFSWTWQCSTLNRGDEVTSMPIGHLQPYYLWSIPNWTDGRVVPSSRQEFGVLAMYHETKTSKPGNTEPAYSYVLPHRDPLKCPVIALAILLHFVFDQENLIDCVPGWDWKDQSTWSLIRVLFGKKVGQPMTSDGLGRMYGTFLDHTTVSSSKRIHLPRRTLPEILEEMGVPADQVDATGHWKGNTRREVYGSKIPKVATVALAGFAVGETYIVPWVHVEVSEDLQKQIFPFCEDVLAQLRSVGCQNQGIINFVELLRLLRPFFWRGIGAINAHFPNAPILKRLNVLQVPDAAKFLSNWPALRHKQDTARLKSAVVENTFQETSTRNAFATVSNQLQNIERGMASIKRRTAQFSPSKKSTSCNCNQLNDNLEPSHTHKTKYITPPPSFSRPSSPLPPSAWFSSPLGSTATLPHLPSTPSSVTIYSPSHTVPTSPAISRSSSASHSRSTPFQSIGYLIPQKTLFQNTTYNVLPLSLPIGMDQPVPRTQHDLILPPANTFTSSTYPTFTIRDCTWQFVFDKVINPSALWTVYAPESLGSYSDIKSLWQAWDEGVYLLDVGRKPPIRLIDAKWGSLKSQETGKGRFPSWRPRNDEKARKIWANFYFFINRIEEKIKAGHSSDEAVSYFEEVRDNRSLSQLHRSLQERKRKRGD